ncbi:MAG TPA: DUF1501 domain-containing protein, partial [Nevskia sp.]|nr:DUF1501 domain-containing protein [Nevskia sp.]
KPGSAGGVLDLDGRFGLHPALAPLLPLWKTRQLAFVHAAGSPDPTRSHFDAQDYMESGTPGVKSTADGWMNRLLGDLPQQPGTLEAVSFGPVLPRIFSGTQSVANVPLGRAASKPTAMDRPEINSAFDRMYAGSGSLGEAYQEGRRSRQEILADLSDPVSMEAQQADNGAPPPQGFAQDTAQLARLMQRNPRLQLAFMQLGGWDTHVNQGAAEGQLAKRLQPLGEGLVELVTQLGPLWDDTVVVVMSEFGRTARENGNHGTDHGHGNLMWILGGAVSGGKVYGDWPGLSAKGLHEGRDLAVTTDFRTVLARVCGQHLRLPDRRLEAVFPQAPQTGAANVRTLLA